MSRIGQVAKLLKETDKFRKDNDRVLRVVGYARFSNPHKVDNFFTSVEAQEAIIREYAKNKGNISLVAVFSDPGKSGKNANRPGYQAMLERIKQGDIDVVLAYKLDRMGRNDEDLLQLDKFLDAYNVKLVYTNGPNFDNTPDGRFQKRIAVAGAVFEREISSHRVSDKYIQCLKNGYMCGGVRPLGYISGPKPGSAIIDKKTAPIIKEIFTLCLDGNRPYEIANKMNLKYGKVPPRKLRNKKLKGGGKSFSENYIRTVILNPFYCGYVYATLANPNSLQVEYQLYNGKHKGIITVEEWQKAVNLLKSYKTTGHNYPQIRDTGKYLLKGVLRCDCKSFMSAASTGKVDDNGEKYRYYVCSKKIH
ncbi:MAG: recombinase family protein, partial [Opitutales bacterium]|nr:recombinase family protein [Opitutales bacterium]